MKDVVGNAPDFIKRIIECRNSEAHCNEDGAQGSGSEHARLASKLRVLIDCMILKQVGVPQNEIEAAMRSSREYWFYASNATWKWDQSP